MTLKQWQNNGWLKFHKTSKEEIGNLLAIVDRDIKSNTERPAEPTKISVSDLHSSLNYVKNEGLTPFHLLAYSIPSHNYELWTG
jgi:hypothetical protein